MAAGKLRETKWSAKSGSDKNVTSPVDIQKDTESVSVCVCVFNCCTHSGEIANTQQLRTVLWHVLSEVQIIQAPIFPLHYRQGRQCFLCRLSIHVITDMWHSAFLDFSQNRKHVYSCILIKIVFWYVSFVKSVADNLGSVPFYLSWVLYILEPFSSSSKGDGSSALWKSIC